MGNTSPHARPGFSRVPTGLLRKSRPFLTDL
jgi:hypothetical protein